MKLADERLGLSWLEYFMIGLVSMVGAFLALASCMFFIWLVVGGFL